MKPKIPISRECAEYIERIRINQAMLPLELALASKEQRERLARQGKVQFGAFLPDPTEH